MTRPAIPLVPAAGAQRELWLPLERAADVEACGGKAVSLGRMLREGLPVPAGFVLTAHALDAFLSQGELRSQLDAFEASLRTGDHEAREAAAAQVRALFADVPLPVELYTLVSRLAAELPGEGPLAVRSSAVGEDGARASFAGLLDSVLGVDRSSGLERSVKHVWASRWSARAAAYSQARGKTLRAMGVIIQVQVDARCAGVLFTLSPEPGRNNEMLCEYCPGLAEKLVAGEITPSRLAIDRASLEPRRAETASGAADIALDAESIEALATAALAAERLFGCAQDIEWALDSASRLWLVQSRPITTGYARAERRIVWSNANVNENFPAPISPLLYSIAAAGYTHYFRNLGRAFGIAPRRLERMAPDLAAIIGVHAGRMYYNLSAIHAVLGAAPFGERLIAWFDEFTGASNPHASSDRSPALWSRGLRDAIELAWVGGKTAWQYLFIERRVTAFEARIDRFAERSAPALLSSLSLIELRDLLRGFLDIRLHRWTDAALADAAAMACYGALKAAVAQALPEATGGQWHNSLLKGLSGLKSAEPVNELWALAHAVRADPDLAARFREGPIERIAHDVATDSRFAAFHSQFRSYLDCWGFRCSGELMLTVESFQERPHELLEIVRAYAGACDADPRARLARQKTEREVITQHVLTQAARQRLLGMLPWPNRATLLSPLLAATQAAIGLRERARLKQALIYSRVRRIALAIGERLVANRTLVGRDDVFFLTLPELDALLSGVAMFPAQTAALVRMRREAHAAFETSTPADVLEAAEGEYPDATAPTPAPRAAVDPSEALRGAGVCGGVAIGPARVLTEVSQTRHLRTGDILVTRQTDPGWAPAFVGIGGLVLERGGMLSHGAILAREYGIPTVVGIAGATDRIASGATIQVDGDHGDVRLVA